MTTKKVIESNVVLLVRDKEELKRKVQEQIQLGEAIVAREINNKQGYELTWTYFKDWDNLNEELIRQAFDNPVNIYVSEYKYKSPIYIDAIYGDPKSFGQEIEDAKSQIRYQITKLTRFYNKIDLLKSNDVTLKSDHSKENILKLINILSRFHKVAQAIRDRHKNQETIIIRDEYDVQDLLNGLLQIYFDDIRKEEYSPSNSGANSRIDFVLKKEKIILEIKMTSEDLTIKKLGEELLVDIGRYKGYTECDNLMIFIYDKGDYIRNKDGFISDLQKQSVNNFKVTVIINPA